MCTPCPVDELELPELPRVGDEQQQQQQQRLQRMVVAYETILRCIAGENPQRAGLLDTPTRAAKAMVAMTSGYAQTPHDLANGALFEVERRSTEQTSPLGLVVVRDIKISSLCEHHLLPFFGTAHIGYLPGTSVLGLSKLARIADALARRLQMQERLTQQLCESLMEVAEARGVAVVVECSHMCMCSRGVKQTGSTTLTTSARGAFAHDRELLREFWTMLGRGGSVPTEAAGVGLSARL